MIVVLALLLALLSPLDLLRCRSMSWKSMPTLDVFVFALIFVHILFKIIRILCGDIGCFCVFFNFFTNFIENHLFPMLRIATTCLTSLKGDKLTNSEKR